MDGVTLVVDAATYEGSAVALRDGIVLVERTIAMRGITEERLMPAVAEVLGAVGVAPGARGLLRRVVCGAGPGSFTSLRIAAGIAKGLCTGFDVPLFAVSSLHLAVAAAPVGRYLVTMDALRDEVYALPVSWDGSAVTELAPLAIISVEAVSATAVAHGASVLSAAPHARAAVSCLAQVLRAGPVDRARWEPVYGRLAEAQVKWEAAHGRPLAG